MSFSSRSTNNIKVFFAYSQHRQDQGLRKDLEAHLHELRSLGVDSKWHKYHIETKQDWENEICEDLNKADLIILLVSPAFMHEVNEHWNTPVKRAKERCEHEEIPLIPVLLRQVNGWQRTLGDLVPLSSNGIAVANSPNRDAAFVEVAQGIVEKVEELKQYQEKLQEYEQHFSEAIQREEPLSEYARELLNQFKHTWNLKERDTVIIEEESKEKQQLNYQQNIQGYKQYFFKAIRRENPLSDYTSNHLKSLQNSLMLRDEDIALIEEQITQANRYKFQSTENQGIGLVVFLGFIAFLGSGVGVNLLNSQSENSSTLPSLASNQIENLTASKKSDGWIFIGSVNNRITPISSGTPLIRGTEFTDSPVVPAIDAVVTVVRNPVSVRKNKPQPPKFIPKDQKELSNLKYGDQIIIHKVAYFVEPNTIPPVTKVWAEVSRCAQVCNKEKR